MAASWQNWWFCLAGCLHPLSLEPRLGILLLHEELPGKFSALGSQVSEALPLPLPPARECRDVQPFRKKAGQTLSESKQYSCFGFGLTGGKIWQAPAFSVLRCQCLILSYIHWLIQNILLRLLFSKIKINISFSSLGRMTRNCSLAHLVFKAQRLNFQISVSGARLQNVPGCMQTSKLLLMANYWVPAAVPSDTDLIAN